MKAKLPADLRLLVSVQSAGTLGISGSPATRFSMEVAREKGADISNHLTQGVSSLLMEQADLILAMSPEHAHFLRTYYCDQASKVFLLRTYMRDDREVREESIEDPIGGNIDEYRQCRDLIDAELDRLMPHLLTLIRTKLVPGPSP